LGIKYDTTFLANEEALQKGGNLADCNS